MFIVMDRRADFYTSVPDQGIVLTGRAVNKLLPFYDGDGNAQFFFTLFPISYDSKKARSLCFFNSTIALILYQAYRTFIAPCNVPPRRREGCSTPPAPSCCRPARCMPRGIPARRPPTGT